MVEGFLSIKKKKTHNFLDQTRRSWPRSTPPSVAFDVAPMNSTDGRGQRGFLKRAKHRLLAPHSITCRKRGGGIVRRRVVHGGRSASGRREAARNCDVHDGRNAGDDSVVVTASFLFCIPTTENREEEKKSHSTTEERK